MNKDRAAALAQRAKNAGMSVMLTLHYSDSWADPGQQTKPAAWKNYTFQQLMDAVWNHTREVMTAMQSKALPRTGYRSVMKQATACYGKMAKHPPT